MELKLTIEPFPASTIGRRNICVGMTVPIRFTFNTRLNSFTFRSKYARFHGQAPGSADEDYDLRLNIKQVFHSYSANTVSARCLIALTLAEFSTFSSLSMIISANAFA